VGGFTGVCLPVCLFVFPHNISKSDAADITKHIFHDESWKSIYVGVKRSKVKVTSHKHSTGNSCTECTGQGNNFELIPKVK